MQNTAGVKKIDHINIVVSNLEAAKEFFCRLGFSVEHQGELKGEWISKIVNLKDVQASYIQLSLGNSGSKLELIKYVNPVSSDTQSENISNQVGIRHIGFAVDDIESLVLSLNKEGIEFFGDIQTYPATGKKLIYFYGPDNIILEFAQYKDN